jgi:ABC-type sugar transport system permease subunit
MLIYIAGLTGISDEILEAASIDGANSFGQLQIVCKRDFMGYAHHHE